MIDLADRPVIAYFSSMTLKFVRSALRTAAVGALITIGVLPASGARAQSVVSTDESFLTAELVSGRSLNDGRKEMGLLLRIAPGWKTYWRQPGEAGIPPRFDWSASENLAGVEVLWPRPHAFDSFGLHTLGYADEVLLPLRVAPSDKSQPIELRGQLAIGVCSDICVVEETEVSIITAPSAPGSDPQLIARWLAKVPGDGAAIGLLGAECRITGAGADRGFDGLIRLDRPIGETTVVLEGPENSWFYETSSTTEEGAIHVTSRLSVLDPAMWIGRTDVRITVLAERTAADIRGCSAPAG